MKAMRTPKKLMRTMSNRPDVAIVIPGVGRRGKIRGTVIALAGVARPSLCTGIEIPFFPLSCLLATFVSSRDYGYIRKQN